MEEGAGFVSEFVLGYSIWHGSQPRRGSFSGLTSAEFVERLWPRRARTAGMLPFCCPAAAAAAAAAAAHCRLFERLIGSATRYDGRKPSYHGAAQFGLGAALVKAIELAGSLDRDAVAAQLRNLSLPEFYSDISFDANGQLAATMLVLQFQANASKGLAPEATITAPPASSMGELQFPMPDWPIRVCWSRCNPVAVWP